ncbi:restriction endonuclease subunit S [Bacillus thuringiensis]|uniref:restriction endonuclease subunit S n=1 Tax=Bacillus thuringiensis TaxID=1428 RepID=UPI002FFDF6C4
MRNKRTPVVRFPGFSGGWEERKLGDLVIDVSRAIKMVDDDIYQLVTVKRRNGGIVSRGIYKGSEVLVKSQFIIKTGDYLISKRQVVHGANGIVPEYLDGSIVSNEYLVLHGTKDLNIEFFSLISELPSMYKNYFLSSYGVDIEKLVFNVADWKKRKISIPSIPEQNQITSLIKGMNKVIALHQQELNILKQTKQGFLQKMFPKEGETLPEIRFPGFTGEWELRKIREIGNLSAGGDINKSKLVDNERYPVLANALTNDGIVGYYDEYKIEAPAVTITGRGDVGHAKARHISFTPVVRLLVLKANGFDVDFLENCINTRNIFVESTGVPQLTVPQLGAYEISFPSFREQIKIGNFFKQLDDTIALHQRELDALKETKKAFLQNMFV